MPITQIASNKLLQIQSKRLIYNDKGRVEEEHSFDSIGTK